MTHDPADEPMYNKKTKRVYLSGVISNGQTLPEDEIERNLTKFFAAEDYFIKQHKLAVINPARYPKGLGNWTVYMRRAIEDLMVCDYIYMVPGWEISKGAKLELYLAEQVGIERIRG